MTDWMAIVAVSIGLGVVVGLMGSLQARRERDISQPVVDAAPHRIHLRRRTRRDGGRGGRERPGVSLEAGTPDAGNGPEVTMPAAEDRSPTAL